jgi:2-aminobenzoate-CoA ligase
LPPPELQPHVDWSGVPELAYPARLNAAGPLLDDWIGKSRGDRPALRYFSGDWSYRRLFETANRIANVLVHDLGLVPGGRVLLRGANQPMLVACWFAVLKAGGVAVTTMPLLRAREISDIVDQARITLAITDARVAADLEAAMAGREGARVVQFGSDESRRRDAGAQAPACILEALMAGRPESFTTVATAADDPAIIAFTSGTTGRSKGTVHTHRDLLAVTDTYGRYVLKPDADDIFIGSPPIAFTYALGGLVLFPMRFGASSALIEQASPPLLLEGIQKFRATITITSPTAYRAMLKQAGEFDLTSLRKGLSAGETLPAATFNAWEKATGIRLMDGIGSTEMLHMFIGSSAEDAKPGSTGTVVPGFKARVVDDDGNDVPIGTIGRLAVSGPTGCRYLGDVANQRQYVQQGWNLTGDAYRKDADGYFWYVSRTDDMIISSGYNISGVEVENVLLTHPGVAECAVVGIADEERGQIVKAFVVPAAGQDRTDSLALELQEFVKRELAPYKYPRAIEFVAELPRTLTGKLQRYRLRSGSSGSSGSAGSSGSSGSAGAVQFHEPAGWARPKGYANAVSGTGRVVFVAGQVGWDPVTSVIAAGDFAAEVRQALANVAAALDAAGARPDQITRLTWYITDRDAYLRSRAEIGRAYRDVIGRHFPAMSVVVVKGLIEPGARVEIEATAMVSS